MSKVTNCGYGYAFVNSRLLYPCYKPTIKTILVQPPESQNLIKLNSCCTTYVKPINEGIKFGSYDRVLRRRRGKALQQ
jgi:hypothetical protein